MRKIKYWKFLRTGLKSENGNHRWKKGQWYKCGEPLEMCQTGFHCSKGIYQAFSYIQGEILAEVEVKGKSLKEEDKECWQQMRVIKTCKWQKKDSVLFSIYAARLVLKYFEEKYPDDKRPREAIEAAERYVKKPTKANREAARAASEAARAASEAASEAARAASEAASEAARAARAASWAASWAARAASWAARAASEAASEAASWAASWAARAASWAASWAALYKKLDKWMLEHLKELKPL